MNPNSPVPKAALTAGWHDRQYYRRAAAAAVGPFSNAAGIETSQGQQREPGSGQDDCPTTAGVPETGLANNPGTVVEWNL